MINNEAIDSELTKAARWNVLLSAANAPSTPDVNVPLDIDKARKLVDDRLVNTPEDALVFVHGEDVAKISFAIGQKLDLDEATLFYLKLGGLFHDIGKKNVPLCLLQKPGRLNDIERSIIRQHVFSGALAVSRFNDPILTQIVFFHHEHYDGSGYLCGLTGKNIPFLSRIVADADSFAAMTTPRAYRKIVSTHEAARQIRKKSGVQYDPEVVEAFLACLDSLGSDVFVKKNCFSVFDQGTFNQSGQVSIPSGF